MRFVALSSTTSTRSPARVAADLGAVTTSGSWAWVSGTVNQKVLPAPGSLSTPISPPIAATSWREMASPSPVPPYLRVVEESACEKVSKIRVASSSATPIPVSDTSKRTTSRSASRSASHARTTTSPSAVNFTALPARLNNTWRIRAGSPRSAGGRSGEQ